MEFKSYFRKFGMGWIVVGVVATLLLIIFNYMNLSTNKNVIENAAKFGKSVPEFMVSFWLPRIIFMGVLLGFGIFFVGFLGLTVLFRLLIGWLIVFLVVGVLQSGSVDSYGSLFTIPLLILVMIIGIILEIKNYHSAKKLRG